MQLAAGRARPGADIGGQHPSTLAFLYPKHWEREPSHDWQDIVPQLASWIEARKLLPTESIASTLDALDLNAFVRLVFPYCSSFRHLLWIGKYTVWLYLADDELEMLTALGRHDDASAKVAEYSAQLGARSESQEVLARTLGELSEELRAIAVDRSKHRKWEKSHLRYWYDGVLMEGRQDAGQVAACLKRKPAVTAVHVYFDLIELMAGVTLPTSMEACPELHRLRDLGALIDGLYNDVLSYERDKVVPSHSNIALSLRESCRDEQQNLALVAACHNELVRLFDALADVMSQRHLHRTNELAGYVQHMRYQLAGLARWQLQAKRYEGRFSTRIVTYATERRPARIAKSNLWRLSIQRLLLQ